MKPARLRHIAITVPDPEKAALFYMKAFGLQRVGQTDWENAKGVYLSDGVINLALLHYKTEAAAGHRGRDFVGVHHFGFEVENVAGLRDACKELNAATDIDKRPPNREAEYRVHDPDGNPIDLSQHGWPI